LNETYEDTREALNLLVKEGKVVGGGGSPFYYLKPSKKTKKKSPWVWDGPLKDRLWWSMFSR